MRGLSHGKNDLGGRRFGRRRVGDYQPHERSKPPASYQRSNGLGEKPMPKKSDVKFVALITLGVMVAGYAMNALSDVSVIRDAQRGYGG